MWMLAFMTMAHSAQDAVAAQLCAERSPCSVSATTDAGRDEAGRHLQVVELNLSSATEPDWDHAVGGECDGRELHLVRRYQDAVEDTRLLLELCNDGYGAHGMGEDTISIGDNRFTHSQYGGSTWRWSSTSTWRLSPFEVVETWSSSSWTMGANRASESWSWETLSGTGSMVNPTCEDQDRAMPETRWLTLPIRPTEIPGGAPGGCAVEVNSANTAGFVVFGKPGDATDGRMRVELDAAGDLLVEVGDDVWVDGSTSWVLNDHVEIWTAPEASGSMDCGFPVEAVQWGIGLDGKVHPAHGSAALTPPDVQVSRTADSRSVRVALGAIPAAITVVYSDTDDGLTQERMIATSSLRFGDGHSLGRTRDLADHGGMCARGATSSLAPAP